MWPWTPACGLPPPTRPCPAPGASRWRSWHGPSSTPCGPWCGSACPGPSRAAQSPAPAAGPLGKSAKGAWAGQGDSRHSGSGSAPPAPVGGEGLPWLRSAAHRPVSALPSAPSRSWGCGQGQGPPGSAPLRHAPPSAGQHLGEKPASPRPLAPACCAVAQAPCTLAQASPPAPGPPSAPPDPASWEPEPLRTPLKPAGPGGSTGAPPDRPPSLPRCRPLPLWRVPAAGKAQPGPWKTGWLLCSPCDHPSSCCLSLGPPRAEGGADLSWTQQEGRAGGLLQAPGCPRPLHTGAGRRPALCRSPAPWRATLELGVQGRLCRGGGQEMAGAGSTPGGLASSPLPAPTRAPWCPPLSRPTSLHASRRLRTPRLTRLPALWGEAKAKPNKGPRWASQPSPRAACIIPTWQTRAP